MLDSCHDPSDSSNDLTSTSVQRPWGPLSYRAGGLAMLAFIAEATAVLISCGAVLGHTLRADMRQARAAGRSVLSTRAALRTRRI